MTTRTPLLLGITLTLALTLSAGSLSLHARMQPPPQAPPAGPGEPGGPPAAETLTPAELNRHFEAYELLQAQQALQLSDEQYTEFIVRLKGLQNARRRHQQTRMRLMQELRRLTDPKSAVAPDEAALRTALDNWNREDTAGTEEIRKAMAHLDEALDLRQRARLRVFEENLERRKLDLLSRVRQTNRDRPRGQKGPSEP